MAPVIAIDKFLQKYIDEDSYEETKGREENNLWESYEIPKCPRSAYNERIPNQRWLTPSVSSKHNRPVRLNKNEGKLQKTPSVLRQSERIKQQNCKRYPYPHALLKKPSKSHLDLYRQEWEYQTKHGHTTETFESFFFDRHNCLNKGRMHRCSRRNSLNKWKLSYPTTVQLKYMYEPPWMTVDPDIDWDMFYDINAEIPNKYKWKYSDEDSDEWDTSDSESSDTI